VFVFHDKRSVSEQSDLTGNARRNPQSLAEVCFTAKLRARKQLGRGVALFDLA
jgi:hypothetical protein